MTQGSLKVDFVFITNLTFLVFLIIMSLLGTDIATAHMAHNVMYSLSSDTMLLIRGGTFHDSTMAVMSYRF